MKGKEHFYNYTLNHGLVRITQISRIFQITCKNEDKYPAALNMDRRQEHG